MKRRLFIALPVPDEARKILAWLQNKLKQEVKTDLVKWVEKENFHQTLVFLGRVDDKIRVEIEEIMRCLARNKPLSLSFSKILFFPDLRRARVIAVNVGEDEEKISNCFHQLRLPLEMSGFEFNTRFSPHICLGRVRRIQGKALFTKKKIDQIQDELRKKELVFPLEKVVLYESNLNQDGPVYTPLCEVELKGKK